MSWKEIEGKWLQFVGEAKLKWSKLTDDDLAQCKGNQDKLVGKLEQLYGLSRDEAGEAIARIELHLRDSRQGAERMYGARS